MTKKRGRPILALLAAGASLLLAACAGDPAPKPSPTDPAPLQVVASSDVYGDIVSQLGGDRVSVKSLITDPNQDPHEYEASARDQLAVSRADLIILNGGGYDDFMERLIEASPNLDALLVRAVSLSRYAGDEENEHVWFDLPSMRNLTDALVDALVQLDPQGAKVYNKNAKEFRAALDAIDDEAAAIRELGSFDVLSVDPAPQYLLELLHLNIVTPEDFAHAVSAGIEPSAVALHETLQLLEGDTPPALVVANPQAESASTRAVASSARQAGVAVVEFTETLAGLRYQDWYLAALEDIGAALDEYAASVQEQGSEQTPAPENSDSDNPANPEGAGGSDSTGGPDQPGANSSTQPRPHAQDRASRNE